MPSTQAGPGAARFSAPRDCQSSVIFSRPQPIVTRAGAFLLYGLVGQQQRHCQYDKQDHDYSFHGMPSFCGLAPHKRRIVSKKRQSQIQINPACHCKASSCPPKAGLSHKERLLFLAGQTCMDMAKSCLALSATISADAQPPCEIAKALGKTMSKKRMACLSYGRYPKGKLRIATIWRKIKSRMAKRQAEAAPLPHKPD